YVKNKRHDAKEVLANIKILRGQFRVDIDDLPGGRKKDGHLFVFKLQENRAMSERNDVDRISLFRVQNEAGIAVRLGSRNSYAGHHPAEVVQLTRHSESCAE